MDDEPKKRPAVTQIGNPVPWHHQGARIGQAALCDDDAVIRTLVVVETKNVA